ALLVEPRTPNPEPRAILRTDVRTLSHRREHPVSIRPRPIAEPVTRLIEELGRLPGIGPKSASRLAYHLLKAPKQQAVALAEAVLEVKEKVRFCSECYNLTEHDPCDFCADPGRDRSIVCVVEEPLDLV